MVEKYEITGNPLFGQAKFSFVDQGYPEIFGYSLEFSCIAVFSRHAVAHQKKDWLAWAAMFVIVLLGDSLGAHKVLGKLIFTQATLSPGWAVSRFAIMGAIFAIVWAAGPGKAAPALAG